MYIYFQKHIFFGKNCDTLLSNTFEKKYIYNKIQNVKMLAAIKIYFLQYVFAYI